MALGGGGNVLGLIFRIKADGTDETKNQIRSLRAEFNKEVNDIKKGGTDAFLSVGNSAGFSTSQLASFAGVIPIVVAGVTAAIGVIAAATSAIAALTIKTAQYGEEVWRAHEKTGLSVATISALKIAGDQVGVSLNSLSTGLVRFTNNLAQAEAGNKKFVNEFGQLGVKSFQDNDKALSEFLDHFAQLRTGQERTLAASQAFGVRMGASFVEMFDGIGGNIDAFKDKLRDMGLLLDTEQAKEAHDFTILYNQITQQLGGLTRQIGFETLPVLAAFFMDASKGLNENQATWRRWGGYIATVLGGVETAILGFVKYLQFALKSWGNFLQAVNPMTAGQTLGMAFDEAGRDLVLSQEAFRQQGAQPSPAGDKDFSLPGKSGKAKKDSEPKQLFEGELQEIRNGIQEREAAYGEETSRLKAEYDQRLASFTEYIAAERKAAKDREHDVQAQITEEQNKLQEGLDKGLIKQSEYEKKKSGFAKDSTKARAKLHEEEAKLDSESYKHRIELQTKYRAEEESLTAKKDQDHIRDLGFMRDLDLQNAEWQIGNLTKLAERKLELELKYNKDVEVVKLKALDREQGNLRDEVVEIARHYAEVKNISLGEAMLSKVVQDAIQERANRVIAIEYERSRIIKETSDANIAAYRDEARAAFDAANATAAGATRPRRVNPLGKDIDQLEKLKTQLKELYGMKGEAFFNALETGLSSIADAAGQVLHNFILFGSAGTSFRKFAAEVIASIAQMAVVKAIWELAEGFAALARAFFGDPKAGAEATAHFHAAAIYGVIAGVAAIAGRTIAGNAFQQTPASASSGSGTGASSSGSGSSSGAQPVTTNISRSTGAPGASSNQLPVLEVHVRQDPHSIVDVFVKDFARGGRSREVVASDGVVVRR